MAAYPPHTRPKPFDVVWSRFPYDQKPGLPAVEPHPALVFAASEYKPGLWAIQVAYGTSNLKTEMRPNDFRVTNFRAMQYAGLNQATRFDMDLIKWLMWDDDWFASPNDKVYETPIIGSLLQDQQDRLRRLLKRREAKGLSIPFKVVAGE